MPFMRATNILLDSGEMPEEITVVMSPDVYEVLRAEALLGPNVPVFYGSEWKVVLPRRTAARLTRWAGEKNGYYEYHEQSHEVYDCLSNIFNRFYEYGVNEVAA